MDKEELEQLKLQVENFEATPKTILTIKTMPKLEVAEDKGVTINDGYAFEVNGALPEIADGIAKLAFEMPKNGFGENSGKYFITLIGQYYTKLLEG